MWFGFDGLGLTDDELLEVGQKSCAVVGACAAVIPCLAALFLVTPAELARAWLFVLLSVVSVVLPAVAVSLVSFEFPTLAGGLIGRDDEQPDL